MEIILLIAIILLAALVLWQNSKLQKIANSNENDLALNLLKTDLIEMNKNLSSMREGFGANLAEFNEKMNSKNILLKEPKVKDLKAVSHIHNDLDRTVTLIANKSGFTIDEIEDFPTHIYMKLQGLVEPFLR